MQPLDSNDSDFRPSFSEDIQFCPFCSLRKDVNSPNLLVEDVDILNHPVWDMDPIPCPSHIGSHVWLLCADELPRSIGPPCLITPTDLEDAKKYLKQVRNSRISRGGQSVTLVGTTLVIFGGQDANRSLLNDLHILDLESMTWDEMDTCRQCKRVVQVPPIYRGVPPSPRPDHAAAVHADRYLLIFGGGSHAACFNDLHALAIQTIEW
ncbi:acyl-CoA-binding domain-containing protein 4 [Orobanche gracilis]